MDSTKQNEMKESGELDEYDEKDVPSAHLEDIADGAGCVEIWDHISEQRNDS